MQPGFDPAVVWDFATALLLGGLVGLEREKRMDSDAPRGGIGGLRTFILIAEIGAIGGFLAKSFASPWILVAALATVTVAVTAGYLRESALAPDAVGLTTETAALVTCLVGGLTTLGYQNLAIGLAVFTAATLAYKQPLHGLVSRIGWDDVFAGLRLLIATFIVLPLLPNRTVDPWGALNPHSVWLLVLLIAGLSLVGYVATRLLGADRGVAVTGLTGGLVSSTAVTLSFAKRSRVETEPGAASLFTSGILLSWFVMCVRIIVLVVVVNRRMLNALAPPFAAMGLVALGAAWFLYRRGARAQTGFDHARQVELKNPFSLTEASKFAAFFAVVILIAKIAQDRSSGSGLFALAALAGSTEVDAIALSMAEFGKTGDPGLAAMAIVIAAMANTVVKCGMAVFLGGSALRKPILVATALFAAAGLAVVALA